MRGKEVGKRERALEEEKAKVLEQYKRAKKLERQGKQREERARRQLQRQANEHFSVVYTTLQLGLKSLSSPPSQMPPPPKHCQERNHRLQRTEKRNDYGLEFDVAS